MSFIPCTFLQYDFAERSKLSGKHYFNNFTFFWGLNFKYIYKKKYLFFFVHVDSPRSRLLRMKAHFMITIRIVAYKREISVFGFSQFALGHFPLFSLFLVSGFIYLQKRRTLFCGGERRKVSALMASTLINGGDSAVDRDNKSGYGGGVDDVYGEDSATLDQLVTPWTVSVAR